MEGKRELRNLTDEELRAAIMDRPDGKLPPPDQFKALTDEWIRRRSRRPSVERAKPPLPATPARSTA
jgi:hypothetical protein